MRKIKKVKETKEVSKTVDILCNMCGLSCDSNRRKNGNKKDKLFDEYTGLIEVVVSGGYMSDRIGDQCSDRFSICEHCLVDKVYPMFKIPREMKDDLVTDFLPEDKFHKARKIKSAAIKKAYSK